MEKYGKGFCEFDFRNIRKGYEYKQKWRFYMRLIWTKGRRYTQKIIQDKKYKKVNEKSGIYKRQHN